MNLNYYYFSPLGYDYSFNETSKITKVTSIQTTTLDLLKDENSDNFFMPDFLSLDTQGSELDILKGSPICLENTLGVVIESEFIEFYENQPCFDEILSFMKSKGFEFMRFTNIVEQNSYNYPIELRSKGRLTDGDALFLRSPEYLESSPRNNSLSYYKLAFIYISFDMLEPALECLKIIDKKWKLSDNCKYHNFLNNLFKCSMKYMTYPKKFTDIYSQEKSNSRYSILDQNDSKIKAFMLSLGPITKILKIIRNLMISLKKTIYKLLSYSKLIGKLGKSEVEILLKKNGFNSLAKIIYKNRIKFHKYN